MSSSEPLNQDLLHALQPSAWARDELGFMSDELQRKVLDSTDKRIIVNCHRQWGKSTISGILCLHRAIFYPKSLCLIVAPSLRQSAENFRKVQDFLGALDSPPELAESTKLSLQLANGARIASLPGSEATIRGYSGPDIIVEDESSRCDDELYQAFRPMLASNPRGRLILASTPWGQRGHFFKTWGSDEGIWLKIKVVASENPRIDPSFLEEERTALGPWVYSQEYEGSFVDTDDQIFSSESIHRALNPDIQPLWGGDNL